MTRNPVFCVRAVVTTCVLASIGWAGNPADDRFRRHDRNNDGKLARDEYPSDIVDLFDRIDTDKDGFVTLEEDREFRRIGPTRVRRTFAPHRDPDFIEERYGPHERNVFDLWQAEGEEPTPLVIHFHGGGFRRGDKSSVNAALLARLLEGGVSVAAANYRLSDTAPYPAQMHDCARAVQYIRAHARRYNIDPDRIAATGDSAGAGISQWLAMHADLADPESEDPVARQSTRLSCAVVRAAQTSYDPRFIKSLFNTDQVDDALIPFFGMESAADVEDPRFYPLFEEASPINHATKDDPPLLLFYPQPNLPLPPNSSGKQHIHHPKFGFVLKERLDQLGVECVVKLGQEYRGEQVQVLPVDDYVDFFFDKLGVMRVGQRQGAGAPNR
jgi:acetyl esterase/lipase